MKVSAVMVTNETVRVKKTIKSSSGEVTIETPQDRQSTFNSQIVKKRGTILAENLVPQIIDLYGKGMSLRDITAHIKEMYDVEVSATTLSKITDRIIPKVKEWQNRPLDNVYPIVWIDAMHYKVRDGGKVVSHAVYNILAINKEGKKNSSECTFTKVKELTSGYLFSLI